MMGRLRITALLLLLCAAGLVSVAPTARAQAEQILAYHSDIEVHDDGSMIVTESIRVNAAGNRIRHGIYRDFPTQYTDNRGTRYVVGFELIGATRDAVTEETRIVDQSNGKRVYLGNANALLAPGEYVYTITYTTTRQIGFFADHDELFWNVTGNGWIFPIQRATATVQLPEKIPGDRVQLGGFTGPKGSYGKDLKYSRQTDGTYSFEASRRLNSSEGLTVLLTWPKGYFAPPTQAEKYGYFFADNREIVVGAGGLIILLIYYLLVWAAVGRDPKPSPIVTLYEPPQGMSPAAMRYLARMGYDNKTFTSAVLNMAVKGFLTIKEQAGSYTLYRTQADSNVLAPDEGAAANQLFAGRNEIWLHNENHTPISAAMKALSASLKGAEQTTYFLTNWQYMVPALVFSVVMLVLIVSARGTPAMIMAGFMCFWLTVWSLAVAGMILGAAKLWKSALRSRPAKTGSVGKAAFLSVFTIPFLGGEAMGIWFLSKATSLYVVLILIATLALHVLFRYLLKAPTAEGRALLDKVEGFKLFLGAVESDPMNRAIPPNKTPEVFEKFLPYALALDLEQAWAEQFSGVLGGAGQSPASNNGAYSPIWYSGADWNSMGAAGFAGSMGGSFSDAISSSSSAPGSSGGGSGGSGGGGGGGGGGGW
jgi:uncharacterized membrane protein YgcG